MLNPDKIISIFCLIDDLFIGINHPEDIRRSVSDSEIAVTALVSALYFGGNQNHAFVNQLILLKIQRKSNSKRPDNKQQVQQKLKMRKRVETTISDIKKMFPRTIHAVTLNGFLIKLILFVFGLQINKITN